jgi:uncharacterized damage-inducible protein DinB
MSTPSSQVSPLINNWNRVHQQTVRLMSTAPSDKFDWKTCDSAMTLGELMNHLYLAEAGLTNAALTGAFSTSGGPEAKATTEEVVAAFEKSHAEQIARVAALTPEQLQEEIMPFGEKAGRMTRKSLLSLLAEHEVHHRGQLYVYLRMLGVEVPALYGA